MPDNVLSAKITADGREFTKTVAQLEAQLKTFQNALKNTSSVESFNRLNRAIEATKVRLASIRNIQDPFSKIPPGANQATQALGNLSRVAQDAPFGFLGIANNLNPLLESFQRLRATTGSNAGALKALGASLTGPAGIGIALSVVSSLLIVFGDKLFGASKAAKELEEANDALAKSTATDLVKLASLVGVITNVNTATRSREQALKDLNKEYGKYLGDLGTEEITLNNIGKAYDKIIDALLRQAVVKGIQGQITAQVEKTAKALLELDQAEQKRQQRVAEATADRAAKEKEATKSVDFLKEAREGLNRTTTDGVIAEQQANRQVVKGISDLTDYTTQYQKLTEELKRQLAPLLTLTDKYADLGGSFDDKKVKDLSNSIIAKAKQVAEYLQNNTTFEVTYKFNPLEDKAAALKRAQSFLDDVSNMRLTLRAMPIIEFDPPRPEAIQQELTQVERGIRDGVINIPAVEVPVVFTPQEARNADVIRDFQKKFSELGGKLPNILPEDLKDPALFNVLNASFENFKKNIFTGAEAIRNAFQNAFMGLTEALGDALSGKDISGNVFSIIGDLIAQIGKALVQYGIVKAGLDKVLKSGFALPGAVAIAIGAAAIAAAQLVKNLKPSGARASGGAVNAGQGYYVGEKGTELFVPNTAGRIVPNNVLAGNTGRMQRQAVVVEGQFVVRGTDLVAALSAANRSGRRLN